MTRSQSINPVLVRKYNQPVPRYTSYPTVPFWKDSIDIARWEDTVKKQFEAENRTRGISLYVHLPFCESLCTYCGCNKKITTNHSVEDEYIDALQKEWTLYRNLMPEVPVIREIHLGGGTPTYFSPENLDRLLTMLLKDTHLHPLHEFSVEGHPNNTTEEHLRVLHSRGFTRISYGVQDNDPEVQRIINRIQPLENVKKATKNARKAGFKSVNFDLIYGLPRQTLESIERTINEVSQLKPDRIAFYSYAHVPWTSKAQRLFDENDLPGAEEKISLYIKGNQMLTAAGYADIGMDHFALKTDELYQSWHEARLHRNFMGYTSHHSGMLIGLGVSSISDAAHAYAQNEKTIHDYYAALKENRLPVRKGYFLSREDCLFKTNIIEISCKGSTVFDEEQLESLCEYTFLRLKELSQDGLVEFNEKGCRITGQGHYFIRNICSTFDLYLQRNTGKQENQIFSKAI